MAETAKHTPTPWGLCAHLDKHDECSCGYRGSIWSADGEHIVCEMGSSPDIDGSGRVQGHISPQAERPTQLADAAFIVRAVNAHDTLVAALRAAKQHMWIDAAPNWTMDDFKRWATVEKIDAALAKAERGQ